MTKTLVQVALGGALGASARYLVNVATMRLAGPGFPWATVIVNVAGSFLMGMLVVALAKTSGTRHAPFLMTGLLGGFTTFSAFAIETVALAQAGTPALALLHVAAHIVLGLGAAWCGAWLAS